jgi:hypothetical protein
MALALAMIFSALMNGPPAFQLFQPSGGVSASRSPQTMRKSRDVLPRAFFAVSVTRYVPGRVILPEMRPRTLSRSRPSGRLSAPKVIGRLPVAVTVKRKGLPGRTPKIRAPVSRGVSGAAGVRMWAE